MSTVEQIPAVHRGVMRPAFQAGFVAMVIGAFVQWWSHHTGVVFAFWDAQAHLDIARRVVDSVTPGLQMLGTVWLPVPHLLMLPFTLVDAWWYNGLAGGIVGIMAFMATVAAVHDLLVRHTGHRLLAWFGTSLVLLNPSLLYLQSTAMTEPVLLAFLTTAAVALDRWNTSGDRQTLLIAGLLAGLSVGTRYDGWFFVAVATPMVAWLAYRADRRWLGDAITFALPSAVMAALWFGYNLVSFGDALAFQRGAWSAQAQQAVFASQGLLPTKGHPLNAIVYYLGATVLTSGLLVTVLGLMAAALPFRQLRKNGPVLLLLAALPFNIFALWGGQSSISLPWTTPIGIRNVRYGIMVLPGLAVVMALGLAGILTQRPRWRRGTLLAGMTVLLAQGAIFALDWPANAGALREGLATRDFDHRQQAASDWLAAHYDGGRILVDEAVNVSPRTRIALRDRVYEWTWQLGASALAQPEATVDWVLVDRHHLGGKVLGAVEGRETFRNRFDRAFDQDGLEIWRRR